MDAFRQWRVWERARRLGLSQLACLGRHTVTGLLYTCGRQQLDWSADYRVFSEDQWEARELFVPITRGVLESLPASAPLVVAMDDTPVKKTGCKIPGAAYRRDPLSPPFHVNLIRAQRFLQVSALLPDGDGSGAARALPVRYEHVPPVPKPKKSASQEDWKAYRKQRRIQNLSTYGVRTLQHLRQEMDERHQAKDRQLLVGVDGSYTNRTVIRGRPERTTLIGRVRKDAKLFYPPRDEEQPEVGAKARYGRRAPTPEQLRQDETVPWQEVTAFGAGRVHTFRVKVMGPLLWQKAGWEHPLQLMVIAPVGYRPRKGSKLLYRQPAYLICTDPSLALEQFIQDYLWRWDVEVNHRDEKQAIGVGQAQLWSPQSVDRQPALAVASYSMLLLAAARAFGTGTTRGTLPLPKWQRKEPHQRLSTQELIRQLRSEVWSHAIDHLPCNSDPFVTTGPAATKCPELNLPPESAMLYAAAG